MIFLLVHLLDLFLESLFSNVSLQFQSSGKYSQCSEWNRTYSNSPCDLKSKQLFFLSMLDHLFQNKLFDLFVFYEFFEIGFINT